MARGGRASGGSDAPVLTSGELNRALLARQLLLERADVPIPAALERIAGIQNQYAPNAYIRLWSCLAGFRREALTLEYERGTVVQGTLMRGTIHAVSGRDYRLFAAAVRRARREWARRIHRDDDADRPDLVARVRRALRGRTCTRDELFALREGASDAAWASLDTDAELLRVPPSGTWERRRAQTYALAEDVLGPGQAPDERDALAHLVRRYLGGFGPASVRDVVSFTGISATTVRPVLAGMELYRFRDEHGTELLDLPGAPLPAANAPAPVRFLPTWDATLLVHARRTGILPEEYRPRIFSTKVPQSFPTFLVDGRVAGTWRHEDGRVLLEPFAALPDGVRLELEREAEALAAFHAR